MVEEYKEKIVFFISFGFFYFKVMFFGLCNSFSIFSWFLEDVLWGL